MVYIIEVSFNIHDHVRITKYNKELELLSQKYYCINYYFHYETYDMNNFKQKCIFTVYFDNEAQDIINITKYIKQLNKIPYIIIDSVYEDDSNKLLYASKYYIQQNHSDNIKEIRKSLNRRYSETEYTIIKSIKHKKKEYPMSYEDYLKMVI